jgi:very-short-patch-repair endonuclease
MATDAPHNRREPTTATPLSPEFLEGNAEAGLEKIRTRLLDLTNRNRLLNFRHSPASSLRVVNVDVDAVFRRLLDAEKLSFQPVPEPEFGLWGEEHLADEMAPAARKSKPSASDYAATLGWPTSYDLPASSESENSEVLPVLHFVEGLETLTRKIGSAAKTAIEESGTNMLYLVLGFLEWYEDDNSQQPRHAPLLTVPVALERNSKGKGFDATIEFSGDDSATNLSLVERMRHDFGIEIPSIEDGDSPENYFSRFKEILEQKKRWRIRRYVTLTLLSFGKLLMYRDLDPKSWPEILNHPLVKELFEGSKSAFVAHAEEYSIDDPTLKEEVPSLILDADSSQHSALMHAMRGQNLVIEGPPGTGKSQTITNLIAAAIGNGKTVLFVAEKLAALEVVRRRLDDAGLGMFCLELHSHKTKKHALLNDVEARLKARGSFREPRELVQHLAVVEEKKRALTQYAELINRRIEPFEASPFEIFWARERLFQELPFPGEIKGLVPDAPKYTRAQFAAKEHLLSIYAQHLSRVLGVGSSFENHPWVMLSQPVGFETEEQIVDLLSELTEKLGEAPTLVESLRELAGIDLKCSADGLRIASSLVAKLPGTDAQTVDGSIIELCRDAAKREILRSFIQDIENASARFGALRSTFKDPTRLLHEEQIQNLQSAFETIVSLQLQGRTVVLLREVLIGGRTVETKLSEVELALASVNNFLGTEAIADLRGMTLLLSCLRLLERTPLDVLHLRASWMEADGAHQRLQESAEEARALQQQQIELGSTLDVSAAMTGDTAERLLDYAKTIEDAGFLQVWFGNQYKQAVRTYRRLAMDGRKAPRERMSRAFRTLSEHSRKRNEFETRQINREAFGSHFKGVETDWDSLFVIIAWCEEVFTAFPEHNDSAVKFRELLLKSRTERLRALKSGLLNQSDNVNVLAQMQDAIPIIKEVLALQATPSCSLREILERIRSITAHLSKALELLDVTGVSDIAPIDSVPEWLESATAYKASVDRISANEPVREMIGAMYKGAETDVGPLKEALAFAINLAQSNLPQNVVEWILSSDYSPRIEKLRTSLMLISSCNNELERIGRELDAAAGAPCGIFNQEDTFGEITQRVEKTLSFREELPHWVNFLRVRNEIQDAGLGKLTGLAEAKTIQPQHLVPAFRFLFYNSLSRSICTEHPSLYQFDRVTQEKVRQQFAQSDKESIRLHSEQLASAIDRRNVPHGQSRGPVGYWTDLALITHEISKQKRHIPIRQLVRRSGHALQALKPCFMMGPLSVAQYLAPGDLQFDLIVMDEASQLKPEDAVGAIARGGQIVIVGDPKQLPPTSFFQKLSIDPEENDDDQGTTVVEEGESILDVASSLYQPVRRLRWHYRSRHHSLIAFSNREFYNDDLIIFPSAYHDDANLGVKYHPVLNGVFENRRNAVEAARVVEAVLEHMSSRPDESLGVVTLNLEQRELIEELLDKQLRTDPFAATYQERMNNGTEPFFVKNLENVQGDERDVMFVSVTYGPDAKGNLFQRFGPINGPNGHRRLNVLFTRAKKRTEVFSSLDPDKIHASAASSWGLRSLKGYLTFARTGVLDSPETGSSPSTNDFENSVSSVLKGKNFHVVPQVGVAGFFIDLAVTHPSKPGKFILGIECDGASYHSGRSARDRDRLRQEILEKLGWKIYRIWSTDWFKNRASEMKRLLDHVEELLTNDPDYRKEVEKAKKVDSLRQQLIDLRETEIKVTFPDSPENGLLRKRLLDEFVARRPRSKEDWFRMFSMELRANTDSRQIARYLDRIFEIIIESTD